MGIEHNGHVEMMWKWKDCQEIVPGPVKLGF
jgi:hypothetical protein